MLVVDAGPLVAVAASRDRHHTRCTTFLARATRPLLVPALVVAEVGYFLADRLGPEAERAFVAALRDAELIVEPVEPADWARIHELLVEYADLDLGLVDASIVALLERLELTELATLDHRHFGVVRPRHCDALTLLPG